MQKFAFIGDFRFYGLHRGGPFFVLEGKEVGSSPPWPSLATRQRPHSQTANGHSQTPPINLNNPFTNFFANWAVKLVIMSNCHRDKRPCAPISFSPLRCYHLGMLKHLLKKEYPSLRKADYEKAVAFIDGKCSQYYFLDYMRTTGGNVDDAVEFYLLDDRLRSLLAQYLIRFEIQLKTDFVSYVQTSTRCSSFWEKRRFYLPDARHPRSRGRASKFFLMKKKILGNISHLRFATPGPSNYLAMYSSSFGTF